MALHQMALFGTTPIGALLVGWIIQVTSPRVPFVLGGLTALACAAAVHGRRRTSPELSNQANLPTTPIRTANAPLAPTPARSGLN